MNNVLNIDDIFKNEQWYGLAKSQATDIYETFTVDSLQFDCITRNTSLRDILHNAHKNWKATSNKLLKKIMKTSDIEKTAVYTTSWNLIKLHMERVNIIFRCDTALVKSVTNGVYAYHCRITFLAPLFLYIQIKIYLFISHDI